MTTPPLPKNPLPDISASSEQAPVQKGDSIHPIVILGAIVVLATILTYLVPSGSFEREGRSVVPGTYETLEKQVTFSSPLGGAETSIGAAQPVSLLDMFLAIPIGLERASGLIFMVLIIGGMFGIMKESGAINAGLEKLVAAVSGNVYVLTIGLMIALSLGSTFLGLASEYLIIIPIVVTMAEKLELSRMIGFGIVTVSAKIGYLSSITNPLPLTIAQPLLGVPVFSGALGRTYFYLVFLVIGIAFMMYMIRREGVHSAATQVAHTAAAPKLSARHAAMLTILMGSIGFLVYASNTWQWNSHALSAYYISISVLLAIVSGRHVNFSATAFVNGMKSILMACFLIGVAAAVSVVLEKGQVLDTVVFHLTNLTGQNGGMIAAQGMFVSQLLLDFLIPSTSGQAAISMPILGPMGQLAGVEPNTVLAAFLFGNGLTNMITPTSGTLLAYLATAKINWIDWAKFVFPLFLIFAGIAVVMLSICVIVGY